MRIVHTMIRVKHLDESLKFYCDGLGMDVLKKKDYESGRFTNTFVGYGSEDDTAVIELTYNWDTHEYDVGDGFGHIAIGVPDVYAACDDLRKKGVKITRDAGSHEAWRRGDRVRRGSQRLQDRAHHSEGVGRVGPHGAGAEQRGRRPGNQKTVLPGLCCSASREMGAWSGSRITSAHRQQISGTPPSLLSALPRFCYGRLGTLRGNHEVRGMSDPITAGRRGAPSSSRR